MKKKARSNEYVPSALRQKKPKPRKIMYAIGDDDGIGGYGMWMGPNPSEEAMLEVIGQSNKSCIIRCNKDGTHNVLWRWCDDRWIRV